MDGVLLKEIIRYSGERQIARFDQVLFNFGGSFIPAGQYSFPFSFKTGENYPASFAVRPAIALGQVRAEQPPRPH